MTEAPTAEECAHALWRAGDLSYLLHTGTDDAARGQEAAREFILNGEHRRPVISSGRRWGKSFLFCVLQYEWALQYPGIHIPYAAPTAVEVRKFLNPHMWTLSARAPEELKVRYVNHEWVYPALRWRDAEELADDFDRKRVVEEDGDRWLVDLEGTGINNSVSRLIMVGCEDEHKADRLRGPGALKLFVDEAGFVKVLMYVLNSVFAPMTAEARDVWGEDAFPQILLSSSPPRELDHPYVGVYETAKVKGAAFETTIDDAPHVSLRARNDLIEDMGGLDSVEVQRELFGKFVVDRSVVVLPEFSDNESIIVQPHERPKGFDGVEYFHPIIVGDSGYFDMTVSGFGYYDFVNDIEVIEDETVYQRETIDVIVRGNEAKAVELWGERPVTKRRMDATPLERAGMARPQGNLSGSIKEPEDRADPYVVTPESETAEHWGPPRKDEKLAAVNEFRIRLKSGRFRVHPRCKTIIAHMKHGRWNKQRTDWVKVESGETRHHYDGLSCALYLHRSMDVSTNPFPETYPGTSWATHRMAPLRKSRDDALRRAFSNGRR